MCFPEREQIGCLWTKSSKREHRGAPTRLRSWLNQQNGAELDLVDTVCISGNATKIIHLLDAHDPIVTHRTAPSPEVSFPRLQGVDPERKCRLITFSSN
jgi:hypothetical protein